MFITDPECCSDGLKCDLWFKNWILKDGDIWSTRRARELFQKYLKSRKFQKILQKDKRNYESEYFKNKNKKHLILSDWIPWKCFELFLPEEKKPLELWKF